MQQLRFLFAMALLYIFRVTISPINMSTYAVYGNGEISPTRCNNCVFILRKWLYSTCFGRQSHPSSGVYMLYMANNKISPTRCNNCFFYSQSIYSTCFGWQSHPSSGVYIFYMANGEI